MDASTYVCMNGWTGVRMHGCTVYVCMRACMDVGSMNVFRYVCMDGCMNGINACNVLQHIFL